MLQIEVYSRADLSRVIERVTINKQPEMTLADVMRGQCEAYTQEAAKKAYISVYADGVKIPAVVWPYFMIAPTRKLKIVIEAGGITASVVMAIISVVLAVASAVYGIIMANRLGKNTASDTKQGSSIYDVNAQGNQINLTNVIPENFGKFKRFPDYLADKHIFYRNNTQFVDMILCQGVGYYARAADKSDVYIGETPIKELPGCSIYVFEPGTVITAENSPGDKSWYCYYSSTEVTPSGHTLEPVQTEIDQSNQLDPDVTFSGDTFSGGYYTYQGTGAGTSGPTGETIRIYHPLDIKWGVGAYFSIDGAAGVRRIGAADAVTDNGNGTSTTTAALADYFLGSNAQLHKDWIRVRITDPDTQEITRAGDSLTVIATARTSVTYSIRTGTGGAEIRTDTAQNSITSITELLAINYNAVTNTAMMILDNTGLEIPAYPSAPSVPGGATYISSEQSLYIVFSQPVPADYPHGTDDGLYQIVDDTGHIYQVQRVSDAYDPLPGWVEFWAQDIPQTDLTFTLDEESGDAGGQYVGPYRACPYGAESNLFEYDISFPSGLGYLKDNGKFRDLTVTIEIGYRRAGSNDEWTTVTRDFTAATNDELAYTYTLETETPGNYEFRMRNLSETDNSTRALDDCKWIGLKSVISTINHYDGMTVMIGRFKGSETLSELSSNQIATYWTRKLPDIYTGDMIATREIAPVVKYIVNNSKYAGIIDQQSLEEYDDRWSAQALNFDGTIDSDSTLLEVLRDVLSVGFASPVIDNNKLAFTRLHVRSEFEPLAQIFTPQNLTASPEIVFNLPKDDDIDEIVVEYTDPETYKAETIYCHVDANNEAQITRYPLSNHQEKLKAFGVTNRRQAEAMGMRRLRYLRSTRVTYTIKTELDGLNCQYNDFVGLVLDEDLSNITGRVTAQDSAGTAISVDMEIPEALSAGVIYIRQKDGGCITTTYTRGDSHNLILADALPAWDSRFDEDLERPYFAIGDMKICWVTDVSPSDKSVELKLVNYNSDVFIDDLPLTSGYGVSPYGVAPYGIL